MSSQGDYNTLVEECQKAQASGDPKAVAQAKAAKLAFSQEFQKRNSKPGDRLGHKAFKELVKSVHK